MFLTSDFVLTKEYAEHNGITINNFSHWATKYPDLVDRGQIVIYGKCTFFKKDIPILLPVDKQRVHTTILTDFSDKLPLGWLRAEFKVDSKFMEKAGYGKEIKVGTKNFFQFNKKFVKKYKDLTWSAVPKEEYESLKESDYSDCEAFQCGKNMYVVCY